MKKILVRAVWFIIAILLISFLIHINGKGGIRRLFTISGIYSVAHPDGYPVVCFVDKQGSGIDCLSDREITGK